MRHMHRESTDNEALPKKRSDIAMENEEDRKILERLRLEYEELEALRAAADTLRGFREKLLFVDERFD
jgi:hypothetical protein